MPIKRYNNNLNSEKTEYSKYEVIHRILMSVVGKDTTFPLLHIYIYSFLHVHIKNLSFTKFSENLKIAIFQIFKQKKKEK